MLLKKFLNKDDYPFYLLTVLFLVVHLFYPMVCDDLTRIQQFKSAGFKEVFWGMIDYSNTLSPRYITHVFVYFLLWMKYGRIIWILLDCLSIFVIAKTLSYLFIKNKKLNIIIAMLISMYPFQDMVTAGFISTTVGYTWVLAGVLCLASYLKYVSQGNKMHWYDVIVYFGIAAFAINQEQLSVVSLIFFVVYGILFRKNRACLTLSILSTFISILNIKLLFFTEAVRNRILQDSWWFPDFVELSFFDKIEIAFTSSMDTILFKNGIFLLLTLLLFIIIWKQHKSNLYRTLAAIPLIICLLGVFSEKGINIFTALSRYINTEVGQYGIVDINTYYKVMTYIPIMFMCICAGVTLINFWIVDGEFKNIWIPIGLMILGFITRIMMGFSPTVWASNTRTYLFLWFSLIAAILWFCDKFYIDIYVKAVHKYTNLKLLSQILIFVTIIGSIINNFILCLEYSYVMGF